MNKRKYKHNYLKELWYNRPWKYIPEVIRFIKNYPFDKYKGNFLIWFRNCLYVNWQVCLMEENENG